MFGWLGGLLGLVDPITKITSQIVEWQAKKINAVTEQQRIQAEENVKKLEAMRDVQIAEAHTPVNVLARAFLMFPIGIFIWKVVIWDNVLDLGSTEDLSPNLWSLVFIMWGFYFVTDLAKLWKR